MGYSYSTTTGPAMCFNPAKSWQLGWYSSKSEVLDPNNDAGTCYSGALYGLDSYTSSPSDGKVLIQLLSNTGQNYHIGFNGRQGINAGTKEYFNEVIVTTQAATGQSESVAHLAAGGSYVISNYDGTGRDVTISVTSVSGSDHAVIQVQCGPDLCSEDGQCDDSNAVSFHLSTYIICLYHFSPNTHMMMMLFCPLSLLFVSAQQMFATGRAISSPFRTAVEMESVSQDRARTSLAVSLIVLMALMPCQQKLAVLATSRMATCLKSKQKAKILLLQLCQQRRMLKTVPRETLVLRYVVTEIFLFGPNYLL